MSRFDDDLRAQLVGASERLSQERARAGSARRRWRLFGGVALISLVGVGGATAGLDLLGDRRGAASAQLIEQLEERPRVELSALPADRRDALVGLAEARGLQVDGAGWSIREDVAVFRLTGGDLCVVSANGNTCASPGDVAPVLSFGYDQARASTFLQVIAPPRVKQLEAETSDGRRVPLTSTAGVVEAHVPGKVTRLHWSDDGRPVSQAVSVEMAADTG